MSPDQLGTHKNNFKEESSVRVGTRYRPERVKVFLKESPVDHVIIGSGIGGLMCAAMLSKAGRKVLVLEQHYTAGGFTHSYQRQGYEWDVGVHYVGMVGNKKTMPGALFHWASEGRLKWDELDACYDAFVIEGKSYKLPVGRKAFKRYLLSEFPDDAAAIVEYCRLLFSVERWLPVFFSSKTTTFSWLDKPIGLLKKQVPSAFYKTTSEVLSSLTDNQTLKAVLTGQWGDSGLPPSNSSFFLHCLIANHYLDGAWYPQGGSSQIAASLLPTIEAAGGKVMTYASVEEILINLDDSVSGVRMQDGHTIQCSSVISGCGWHNTERLLAKPKRSEFTEQVQGANIQPSACHICLYVGFDESPQSLNIPVHNLWVHSSKHSDDDWENIMDGSSRTLPFVYISSSAARDSTWNKRYPNKAVMELVAVIPQSEFSEWSDSKWGKRGDDYLEKKSYWSEKLLAVLYEHYPQLEGKVRYSELSTPLSTQHFMNYASGEIYGLAHTPERYDQAGLKPSTNIQGLLLTGQDALTSGVVGAAMSGVFTAGELLGKDFKLKMFSPFRWLSSLRKAG